jgi:hypothetical protein
MDFWLGSGLMRLVMRRANGGHDISCPYEEGGCAIFATEADNEA